MKTLNTQQQAKILLFEALAFFNAITDTRFKYRHNAKVMHAIERAEQRVMRRSRLHSAWFANPSPDSAVLENAVVEIAQGATNFEIVKVYDKPRITVSARSQTVLVQPIDSFFDPLPPVCVFRTFSIF